MKPKEGDEPVAEMATPEPAHEVDISKLLVYYDGDHMLPRSITVRDQDGAEQRGMKRLVIEITPHSLPKVLELET